LKAAQLELANGPHGTEKPMSCSTSVLAKVAGQRPDSIEGLERIIGEGKAERFGEAFLEILAQS
jgi:ATP-dependent DNA helicase RecQ